MSDFQVKVEETENDLKAVAARVPIKHANMIEKMAADASKTAGRTISTADILRQMIAHCLPKGK